MAGGTIEQPQQNDEVGAEDFHRGLKERHIQMIAIGGAIGVGLFLGSATAIQKAGPSLLFSYAVAGVVISAIAITTHISQYVQAVTNPAQAPTNSSA